MLLESPLDKIEPYMIFRAALMSTFVRFDATGLLSILP